MHDGSEETLEAVVDFYNRGGMVKENISPFISHHRVECVARYSEDLVAFLKSLDGGPIEISSPKVP